MPSLLNILVHHPHELMLGLGLPGIILVTLLLSSFAYLACRHASRRHLDRVSFRLLVLALIANLLYGILLVIRQFHPAACGPVSFLSVFSTLFVACMFFSMALNLQLVLVYGVNGNMMEKYYIIGSSLLSLTCSITPYAAGQLGWTDSAGNCWVRKSTSTSVTLHWYIGTQALWILLMSTGELTAFITISCFMLRQQLRFRKIKGKMGISSASAYTPALVAAPIVKYRNTILRIGLYPVLSCFWSITSSVIDVYLIVNKHKPSQVYYTVIFISLILYALRPILYVLLAVTDPGVLRAVRALRPSPPEKPRLASIKSMQSTLVFHTRPGSPRPQSPPQSPRRFSEARGALVRVELGAQSTINIAKTWPAQSMEVREVQFVYPQDREADTSNEVDIRIVEDDSIVSQF
ncbi:hypothetical protein C8R44DRAFT_766945 [Mycena epipterygia]|nr:hypothetical protein C8R44DRAFT_766945 [Mycena epipterygia]